MMMKMMGNAKTCDGVLLLIEKKKKKRRRRRRKRKRGKEDVHREQCKVLQCCNGYNRFDHWDEVQRC